MEVKLEKVQKMDYALTESYNTLRTNIRFCGDDIQVIMLTSCTPNEGKSTVALNMGRFFAEDGKKVVLVDADLRKSVLLGRHGVTSNEGEIMGLSHCLTGQAHAKEILYQTNITNFSCIFAGPVVPNPTELLGNKYFEKLIQTLRDGYDYIIIDAPPLGAVIDAAIISKVCDGTVIVIENNKVSYKFVQNIKKQLDTAGSRILGTILNKMEVEQRGYYNGYYKHYGQYQYGEYMHYAGHARENDKRRKRKK